MEAVQKSFKAFHVVPTEVYNHDIDLMSFESTFYDGIIVVINQYIIQNDKSHHAIRLAS